MFSSLLLAATDNLRWIPPACPAAGMEILLCAAEHGTSVALRVTSLQKTILDVFLLNPLNCLVLQHQGGFSTIDPADTRVLYRVYGRRWPAK